MTDLQRIVELGATTASEMTGMGSPIGSVAAGTGSPFGQWLLVRGGASPHMAPTASISCSRVREATGIPGGPLEEPGIGFAASARSPVPALRLVDVVPGVTAGPRRFSLPLEGVLHLSS